MKLLILIDYQNDFINGSLGTPEAQKIKPNIIEKIKSFNGPIIGSLDSHSSEEDYLKSQEGKKLPIPHCVTGTLGWLIPDDILNLIYEKNPNGYLIEKETFGSFDLIEAVKRVELDYNDKITEIELIGVCTDICVITNALILKTALPDVNIVCDPTCCAGTTPEAHKAALTVMRSCQIDIKEEI